MPTLLFDTETTGLLKPNNIILERQPKIIEFYGILLDKNFNPLDEVNTLIHPGEPLSPEITRITGINDSALRGKPSFGEVAPDIISIFRAADLSIAHNIAFDNGMLANEFSRIGAEFVRPKHELCTSEVIQKLDGKRMGLGVLHNRLLGTKFSAHRAKDDVHALIRIYHKLLIMGGIIPDDICKD